MCRRRLFALLATSSLIALATPAFAQSVGPNPSQGASGPAQNTPAPPTAQNAPAVATGIQEVVVTAEKRSERLSEVPMSVTAITGAALDKLQERSFTDYAATIPGLSLTSAGPGVTRLTLRGLNAGGVGSTVATYVDEAPFGSSTALVNGSILTGDFDTFDLQRIEVLRGPQGTLYGANSEGGLLKFVTNAPRTDAFAAVLEATGETVSHGDADGSVHGMINAPIGDKAAFRISAFGQGVPGYIDSPSLGRRNINDGYKDGGRASLLLQPTDKLSIRLTAFVQETVTHGSTFEDVDAVTLAPIQGGFVQQRAIGERNEFRYQNYNGTLSWDLGPVNLISSTSYSIFDTRAFTDETAIYGALLSVALGGALGSNLENDSHLGKFTQEVRLSSAPSDRFEWLVGGYYTNERGSLNQRLDAFTLATRTTGAGLSALETVYLPSSYREYAGFGDITVHFTRKIDLQVGGRYASNRQDATEVVAGPLVGGEQRFETPSSNDVFTWSVAPRWRIDPNNTLYARIATGFRPGGPNVLPPGAPPSVPRQYNSDRTTNYEVGFRTALFQRRLSLDLAAFYIDWRDIQLFELINNFGINGNGGSAKSQGVEYTVALAPIAGLNLTLSGAYTDALLTSSSVGINAAKGDRLPYVPKWSNALDGEYDWPVFGDFKALVGGTLSYVGERYTDFSVTAQRTVPNYTKLDLRAGIQNRRWLLELYARNVNDERGIVNYLPPAPSSNVLNGNAAVAIIQPRTVGVLLSVKF